MAEGMTSVHGRRERFHCQLSQACLRWACAARVAVGSAPSSSYALSSNAVTCTSVFSQDSHEVEHVSLLTSWPHLSRDPLLTSFRPGFTAIRSRLEHKDADKFAGRTVAYIRPCWPKMTDCWLKNVLCYSMTRA
jgi:hypothetical protein